MSDVLTQVLDDYEAAWNEPDAAARARLLAACAIQEIVMAPGYKPDTPLIRGREALSGEIGAMIAGRPADRGFRLTLADRIESHHGWARFAWRVVDPGGTVLRIGDTEIAGLDVVQFAQDGRLATILVFVG